MGKEEYALTPKTPQIEKNSSKNLRLTIFEAAERASKRRGKENMESPLEMSFTAVATAMVRVMRSKSMSRNREHQQVLWFGDIGDIADH